VDEPEGIGAWRALLRAHAAVVREIEREVDHATRLPLTSYDVLLELANAPDRRLRMQELADRVTLSRSRVSRVVDDLVRVGLVAREPDPSDGRASFAVLTPVGRTALRKAAPVYLRGIETHFLAHLSPDERATIERALQRVVDAAAATG
jgi:DNA-binding MarR family transcriptional regulator